MISLLSTLPASASKEDKVFAAIQDIVGKQIVSVVDEASKYCFKCFDGEIKTIDMDFVNDFAGV